MAIRETIEEWIMRRHRETQDEALPPHDKAQRREEKIARIVGLIRELAELEGK